MIDYIRRVRYESKSVDNDSSRVSKHSIILSMDRFKVLNNFKEEWHLKTPKQKWLFIYYIPAKMCEVLGIRVFTDSKINWFSYFPLVVAMIHFPSVLYTLWIYHKRGEILIGMQCLCTTGIMISVSYN